MRIADIAVKRPVLVSVIVIVFVLFGFIAFRTLNLNLFPDVKIPFVTVQCIYPGAGPKEIESLVTKKIEDVITTIEGVEAIDSYSLDGVSIIVIEFGLGKDVDVANQEVKDKIDQIVNNLPTDAKKPIITKVDFRAFPVANLILSGDASPVDMYEFADKVVKNKLSQVAGVANITLDGGQEREIQVTLSGKTVYENMMSLPAFMGILGQQNFDIPGGTFEIGNQDYSVRLKGQYDSLNTILETEIPTAFGVKKIRELAKVEFAGKKVAAKTMFYDVKNNIKYENAILLGLIKSPDGNVVEVVKAVKEKLPEILRELPKGMELKVVNESADFVESTSSDTLSNIYLGILLTALVLLFFLHDIRSTIIASITMPASIISAFVLFQFAGLDLNMMSLMGISVTVGVLVANAVVIIENIFRFKEMGMPIKEAAIKGTNEVFVAVLASTMTNLVVFIPLANLSSTVGQFLKALALSATFTTLFSLIYSFTLTPMLSSLLFSDKAKEKGKFAKFLSAHIDKYLIGLYGKTLRIILRNKKLAIATVVSAIILFIVVLMGLGPKIGFEFQPTFDQGVITAKVELPTGYNVESTEQVIKQIEDKIKHYPEVTEIVSSIGKSSNVDIGTNLATVSIYIVDKKERTIGIDEMVIKVTDELSSIPNAKIQVFSGEGGGQGGTAPVEFFILGQNSVKLQRITDELYDSLKTIPGLINFEQSTREGKPEMTVYPNRSKLADVGLSVSELAMSLRLSVEGMASSKYKYEGEEYDITVKLNDDEVNSPEKISQIPIATRAGVFKISDLADIKFTPGPTKVLHRNKYITIKFSGAPGAGVPLGDITSEVEKRIAKFNLPKGYQFAWGGSAKLFKQMVSDLSFAFMVGILLTYFLMAAILESYIQPLYIMITIPMGMIGVITFSYLTGTTMSITAMMGVILLTGIVVNNAILLLDFANQMIREKEMNVHDALIESGETKLMPILMSNAALALGVLPLALGIGDAGVEMRTPLGIVTIGGIFASTLLTLYVIPALYLIFAKLKKKNKNSNIDLIAEN
ncbi:MAG: acriflavin resistance protein [Ignavibacteria bacterium GWF2_33_9]|nr:MAG: acriflavin resistance protein [Ignavibacteria bacterium GWF2_33_9]